MAELKTKQNNQSVKAFLDKIPDKQRRKDCYDVLELMKHVTKKNPKMWGGSMVGFGSYHYKYESGNEGDYFLTGFSPRKGNLTLYVMSGFSKHPEVMSKLGKYKTGKSCLYIKKLEDINLPVLKKLLSESVKTLSKIYNK